MRYWHIDSPGRVAGYLCVILVAYCGFVNYHNALLRHENDALREANAAMETAAAAHGRQIADCHARVAEALRAGDERLDLWKSAESCKISETEDVLSPKSSADYGRSIDCLLDRLREKR